MGSTTKTLQIVEIGGKEKLKLPNAGLGFKIKEMNKTVYPGSVWGRVDIPASKSQTIHALLIALFAKGKSIITNPLFCADTEVCMSFCRALGAKVYFCEAKSATEEESGQGNNDEGMLVVDSSELNPVKDLVVDCRSSGTTLYFATALSCSLGVRVRFTGDRSLGSMPAKALLGSLKDLGADVDLVEGVPYCVRGPLRGGHTSIRCMMGPHLNALLLACPLCQSDTTIDVHLLREKAGVRTTEIWLEKQGINFFRDRDMRHYTIRGGQVYKPLEADINGDFSLAAFFFCAAAITGMTITIGHLDCNSSQADRAILDILTKMGCNVRVEGHSVTLTGPSRLKAVDMDLGETPDLITPLAVTASFASGPVRMSNVSHGMMRGLRERSSAIAQCINSVGGRVQDLGDSLVVYPVEVFGENSCGNGSAVVKGFDDPRVAMAMAIAALRSANGITIENSECVDQTYPRFFEQFQSVVVGR